MLRNILLAYFVCGLIHSGYNLYLWREAMGRDAFVGKSWKYWLGISLGIVLWLPFIAMFHLNQSWNKKMTDSIVTALRGPSAVPIYPEVKLPSFECMHPSCRSLQSDFMLWCEGCGALSVDGGESFKSPKSTFYVPPMDPKIFPKELQDEPLLHR